MKDLAILRTLTQRTVCVILVSLLLALQAESAFSQTIASSTPHENPGGAIKNYDCVSPPGWDIVPTPTSFIIIIANNAVVTINGERINTCDFVGCFYRDDVGNLKCGGACAYTQNGANAFVAFGDDPFTPEKEGFVPGDTMFFKIFSWSCAGGRTIDVDTMAFDPLNRQTTYIWNPNNQTAITYMACCTDFDCQIAAPVPAKKYGNHTYKKSRNTGKSFLSDFDDLNNQSNHFYYYNSNNTIGYDVEPLDYKVSTVTKAGKPIGNWNFEDGCPYNLTTRESGSTEESGSLRWTNLIGMPGRDDFTMNILEHYDRGYLISGNIYYGDENIHGWLIKTDINGQVLWDKVITTLPDKALISKTIFDSLGNIYVFGWLIQNQPHEFPLIAKLDACGELQWCRLLAIDGYNFGDFNDALFLDNGDLLGLAYMPEEDASNNNRIILFRISPEGDLIWKKGYATHDNHPYYGDPNGVSIYHFGDIYMISGNVYSPYPNSPNPYHVYQRPMFIGINEKFEEDWIVEFGINDSLLGKAETVVPINDTLFMGVGRYRFINENGDLDMKSWLMYFNNKGEEVGYKIIDDEQFGSEVLQSCLYEVKHIEDDKYLLSAGYVTSEISAKGDLVADTAGNVYNYTIRENTISGGNIYLEKTFDKKYVLDATYQLPNQTKYDIYLYKINENLEQDTVYPGNYTYDSLCGHSIESGVIDLGGCDVITGIGEIPTLEAYNQKQQTIPVTASPNPTNTGEILLEFENTSLFDNLELKVFDVFGKQVHTGKTLPHQGAARLDVSSWARGMYVAVVFSYGEMKGKCKVVVE